MVVLRAARRGVPKRAVQADVVVLAVRDADIARAASALSKVGVRSSRPRPPTVLHCAGGLGPDVLASCRERGMVVAQFHPLLSFAARPSSSGAAAPTLHGGTAQVRGDARAVSDASYLAKRVGLVPRRLAGLPAASYHAAGALVANGGATLCHAGIELLHASGVGRRTAARMLAPLLRSVAENVERLGMPEALSGPVRRGDAQAVERHLAAIARDVPTMLPAYLEVARAQVVLARELGEASPSALKTIERALSTARQRLPRGARGT